MTNKTLQIILKLRDELTKKLHGAEAKMRHFANSFKENWMAAAAAITGAVLAIRKAWDMMEMGAKAEQQKKAFEDLARAAGMNADQIVRDLKKMSGETMSTTQVMEKASQAMILGIDPTKLAKMMEISRASARAFGKDVGFMFESIATGVGRQSKLILDNLGIIVRASDAYEKYAKSIGKSAKELTEVERKQAFLNATLEAGEKIIQKIDTSTMTNLERIQKLKAGWRDLAETIGRALWRVFGAIYGFLNTIISGFFNLLRAVSVVFKKILEFARKVYEHLSHLPGAIGERYEKAITHIDSFIASVERTGEVTKLTGIESAKTAMEYFRLAFTKAKEANDTTADILKNTGKAIEKNAEAIAEKFNAIQEFAKQTAGNMQTAFSNLFFKTFTNDLKNLKEVFADFGEAMLRTISNILAKLVVIKILTAAAGPGGQLFGIPVTSLYHRGGIVNRQRRQFIRAHAGLSPDEVPIIAQTGEGIISRRGMQALGGSESLRTLNRGEETRPGGVTIHVHQVIQAWDAQDVWRNRKTLSAAIADDIYSNGKIRSVIRNYA